MSCEVDTSLEILFKKFRVRKSRLPAVIIARCDLLTKKIVFEEAYEEKSLNEIKDYLPEREPRFLAYTFLFKHEDGRISQPLVFIYVSPFGCKPELQTLYSTSVRPCLESLKLAKCFTVREIEEISDDWLMGMFIFTSNIVNLPAPCAYPGFVCKFLSPLMVIVLLTHAKETVVAFRKRLQVAPALDAMQRLCAKNMVHRSYAAEV
ncbi:glia maturation factor beta-like [Zophobas morio]|uniref:glia maturation factor beta-like n=1 Tax=Zophobas morio TaxID=2755281 RepID=UPI003082C60D